MKTKKIWANLAVDNLERTTNFYTQIGFTPNGSSEELTSFIFGEKEFIIHFFLKDVLQTNIKGTLVDPGEANEIIFTISASSTAEADAWAEEVRNAGGTLVSQPEAFGKGYYGFVFADPDGHRFNVFFMEGL